MKILKRILFFVIAIVAIALITALFVSKDMKAEREIVINKPKAEVFNYIKSLKNQDNYSKWSRMDPNMKKTYTGTDGTVGFVSAWDGNKDVGKGEQEIKKITEGERVDFELRFIKPWESKANAFMTTTAVNDSTTKVVWGFDSKMAYPMNLMKLFMDMDKAIGDDFATGLTNLKANLEK
ncbi:MAG: SRPBCC family protein [Chitinophagaceae bacterium]|nr:SRPBCC family protein [Chitinophagaceae bacterium]